jgi:hypothetical protein
MIMDEKACTYLVGSCPITRKLSQPSYNRIKWLLHSGMLRRAVW